jgi:hypothetical protein
MIPTPSAPSDLRKTLDDSLLVRHISAKLETCRGEQQAAEVQTYMEQQNFDVMALLEGDRISSYVCRKRLGQGSCRDNAIAIEPREIVSSTTPIIDLLPIMKDRDHLFVLEGIRLESIVTTADFQKPPVRMLLFGLVSLLDMFLLVLVRRHCPELTFYETLTPKRLEAAQRLYDMRKASNQEIDLADCLQICDKRDLILKILDPAEMGFKSKSKAREFFEDAEKLRDQLAHSQDLVSGTSWPELIDLASGLDSFLRANEGMLAH